MLEHAGAFRRFNLVPDGRLVVLDEDGELLRRLSLDATQLETLTPTQELMARVQSALRTKALYDELKATREKLTEAEKLVALGQMSITLHHEINNPLQAIMLLAESMMGDISPDDPARENFDEIMKGCLRIQEVLKKVKNIKRVRSAPYVGETDMLDLEKSS